MIAYAFSIRTENGESRVWEVRPRKGIVSIRCNTGGENQQKAGLGLAPATAARLVQTLRATISLLSLKDTDGSSLEYFSGGFHVGEEEGICNVLGVGNSITVECLPDNGSNPVSMTLSEAARLVEIIPLAIPEAELQKAKAEAEAKAKAKKNPEI